MYLRKISEQILKGISEKVASGELEDAFTTIDQMSSGFKERKGAKPKVILRVEPGQADQKGESGEGEALQGHPTRTFKQKTCLCFPISFRAFYSKAPNNKIFL